MLGALWSTWISYCRFPVASADNISPVFKVLNGLCSRSSAKFSSCTASTLVISLVLLTRFIIPRQCGRTEICNSSIDDRSQYSRLKIMKAGIRAFRVSDHNHGTKPKRRSKRRLGLLSLSQHILSKIFKLIDIFAGCCIISQNFHMGDFTANKNIVPLASRSNSFFRDPFF